jgi:aldehyde dehydrogenase (NAD+)
MNEILKRLDLGEINAGTWSGEEAFESDDAKLIESVNPANGEVIASVRSTTADEYDKLVRNARAAFLEWRKVPAPVRGEAIRLVGAALRDYKDALGSLVSLEMGKIKAEGDGEVQEMIDITDFAVGQSRMLYGNTMQSERPSHRMYEQWHPLGIVGTITSFNFPVAVWSWNACIASICGNVNIWKPSSTTPLCGVAVQKICNQALADADTCSTPETINWHSILLTIRE